MHLHTNDKVLLQSLKTQNTALIAKFARNNGVSFYRASFMIKQGIMLNKLNSNTKVN